MNHCDDLIPLTTRTWSRFNQLTAFSTSDEEERRGSYIWSLHYSEKLEDHKFGFV